MFDFEFDVLTFRLKATSALLVAAAVLLSCATGSTQDAQGAAPGGEPSGETDAESIQTLPDIEEFRRGDLLEGVHPELVERIRLMAAVLQQEGVDLAFASGYRPFEHFYDAENRLASWHNLGMAVDLYLAHRDSYDDAKNHYEEDEEIWERVGEVAAGLGLIWGESFDDPYHFEWHPGYHARIRQDEFDTFQNLAGDDLQDYREVWSLFDESNRDPDIRECSGGCLQIPDDGLRALLDRLR